MKLDPRNDWTTKAVWSPKDPNISLVPSNSVTSSGPAFAGFDVEFDFATRIPAGRNPPAKFRGRFRVPYFADSGILNIKFAYTDFVRN